MDALPMYLNTSFLFHLIFYYLSIDKNIILIGKKWYAIISYNLPTYLYYVFKF